MSAPKRRGRTRDAHREARQAVSSGAVPGMAKALVLVGKANPVLHRPARIVGPADEARLVELAPRLVATVRSRRGMALAAPQVGVDLQAVTLHNGETWLNPQVRVLGVEREPGLEGCLSLPGRWYTVDRFLAVEVVARQLGSDTATKWTVDEAIWARCWQHEADHLAGRLISDSWPEASAHDRQRIAALPTGAAERLAHNANAALQG